MRITVQLILNTKDGVGAHIQKKRKDTELEVIRQRLVVWLKLNYT